MSEQTVWQRLAAPLPVGVVQQRQGPGGRMLDYIDWPFIQHRLDEVVQGEWDLTLEALPPTPAVEEPFACKARLQILGIVRENIGTGKDWKDAATDASKRAAVRFGIGLELYEKGAKPAQAGEQRRPPQSASASASTATASRAATAPASGSADASCPKCGGRMWDNRVGKKNPKAPDFKCRDRSCDGVIWPPKNGAAPAATLDDVKQVFDAEEYEQDSSLPF